jgi:type I restriction-modification system DNA methylase subunit
MITLQATYANEHEQNLAIEQYIEQLPSGVMVNDAQREVLLRYTGRGQAFKKDIEISADAGLYEFYTPDFLRERMWALAAHYGFKGGNVLEPSCATAHMFLNAPTNTKLVGFEINPTTAKIAQLCFPKATIYNLPFETMFLNNERGRYNSKLKGKNPTWLAEYPFDLVIGNPPYGKFQGRYVSYFENWMQIEHFFLYQSLKLVKSGGLVVFLTASSWLRNGNMYEPYKTKVLEIATLVDAYRTGEVFKHSGVPTDILIYRKK